MAIQTANVWAQGVYTATRMDSYGCKVPKSVVLVLRGPRLKHRRVSASAARKVPVQICHAATGGRAWVTGGGGYTTTNNWQLRCDLIHACKYWQQNNMHLVVLGSPLTGHRSYLAARSVNTLSKEATFNNKGDTTK